MIWCLLFLCFFSSTNLVEATCTKISDCACRLPDGRIVNLTEIANKNETEPAPYVEVLFLNGIKNANDTFVLEIS